MSYWLTLMDWADEDREVADHGTVARYNGGCRCRQCHAARMQYQREYRAKRKAAQEQACHPSN